ncbi:hypothetical protein [Thiomonas sp. FB-Cd]|uniref:hypothetical protein n=1 Tax=Thiomonas sp. FB-Cd TaxID=1158292 RepID=UPI0004DF0DA7|nr:hypothetical protein [Thiomonas sp. FB-Cd]
MTPIIQLQTAGGVKVETWLTLGEVVGVHISNALLKEDVYDSAGAQPILLGGEPSDYFAIDRAHRFRMVRRA